MSTTARLPMDGLWLRALPKLSSDDQEEFAFMQNTITSEIQPRGIFEELFEHYYNINPMALYKDPERKFIKFYNYHKGERPEWLVGEIDEAYDYHWRHGFSEQGLDRPDDPLDEPLDRKRARPILDLGPTLDMVKLKADGRRELAAKRAMEGISTLEARQTNGESNTGSGKRIGVSKIKVLPDWAEADRKALADLGVFDWVEASYLAWEVRLKDDVERNDENWPIDEVEEAQEASVVLLGREKYAWSKHEAWEKRQQGNVKYADAKALNQYEAILVARSKAFNASPLESSRLVIPDMVG